MVWSDFSFKRITNSWRGQRSKQGHSLGKVHGGSGQCGSGRYNEKWLDFGYILREADGLDVGYKRMRKIRDGTRVLAWANRIL